MTSLANHHLWLRSGISDGIPANNHDIGMVTGGTTMAVEQKPPYLAYIPVAQHTCSPNKNSQPNLTKKQPNQRHTELIKVDIPIHHS